jgi:hypothetical protein
MKGRNLYLVSVHKVVFFVIPAEAGIQNLLKTLDSGLRTARMTESKNLFMDRLYLVISPNPSLEKRGIE